MNKLWISKVHNIDTPNTDPRIWCSHVLHDCNYITSFSRSLTVLGGLVMVIETVMGVATLYAWQLFAENEKACCKSSPLKKGRVIQSWCWVVIFYSLQNTTFSTHLKSFMRPGFVFWPQRYQITWTRQVDSSALHPPQSSFLYCGPWLSIGY